MTYFDKHRNRQVIHLGCRTESSIGKFRFHEVLNKSLAVMNYILSRKKRRSCDGIEVGFNNFNVKLLLIKRVGIDG
jgi:hypothetical protein